MGIFDKIKSAIWGSAGTASAAPGATMTAEAKPVPAAAATAPDTSKPAVAPSPAAGPVDVAAVLDAAVKRKGQTLHWRTSIVDLMKALDLDSSLSHRKELAQELGYTGDMNDSAAMNIWLHKQVIQKLKENGGKVPADLL
ncbi:DUF3597 domain-containing protein [Rhodoligotrophos defluvii]|uniref:DUF3597 domain-containing protein n=1 Tax=Rhodoligotrophos defluvii TaxID=2561934 RepID=UPI0010CA14EC|nr:DUF3597 domain-containing protein [Rhodoligotrophos defluvii]